MDGRRGQRECRLELVVDSAGAGRPSSHRRKRWVSLVKVRGRWFLALQRSLFFFVDATVAEEHKAGK